MASVVTQIKAPIEAEMIQFQEYFRELMRSDVYLLDIVTRYILKTKGKQMRPMFVFLTAKLNGEVGKSTYVAASLIELLHTATLVHDDVVDNSEKRRGAFSIKALWKSKIAVLVGDYFLSKGLLVAVNNNEYELLKIMSTAVEEMAEGELIQLEKSRRLNITEADYFEIIKKKTAALIAASTAAGAKSVKTSDQKLFEMKEFGYNIGIAFQIKDDLFDYEPSTKIGKPKGNDIQEKKMTLPLIAALNSVTKGERKQIMKIVKKKNKSKNDIQKVIEFVKNAGGVEYAQNKMNEFKQKAFSILNEYPNSDIKLALNKLISYTTERKK